MTAEKVVKVAKLLRLGESNNDAEALSALRMANQILKRENTAWEDLLHLPVATKEKKPSSQGTTLSTMIAYLQGCDLYPWAEEFVASIAEQYAEYGSLTPKQKKCLKKIFNQYHQKPCSQKGEK